MNISMLLSRGAIRPLVLILVVAAATPLLSSCVSTAIMAANAMDRAATRKDVETARKKQIEIIKALQAKGNPLGDYLFALANAEGWWPENPITDPLEIKALYEKAAERGSSDAMIVLGIMLILGRTAPQYQETNHLEHREPEKGLNLIEKGMNKRCFYIQPVPDYSADRCFVQYSPAGWIWPKFRDGFDIMNKNGDKTALIIKNQSKEKYWREKEEACEASPQIKQKILACH